MSNITEQIDINHGFNVYKEIDEYEEVIKNFLAGKVHPERFKSYRLVYGTYGVRHHKEGIHMQRIKIPGGILVTEQIRTIAELTRLYAASGHAHITTRQDVQLHYISLENIPTILRKLAEVGITTREACGNSIRNVTASWFSGINPKEIFDVVPYALYCTRYFLRHPLASTLPRKFKISFSESDEDFAYAQMHDIGAIAQLKNGKRGFKVYVGGGLGAIPMTAYLLTEFVPAEEFYVLVESVLRIFHREGKVERENRNKARLKFYIARIGFDTFSREVFSEMEFLTKVRTIEKDLQEYINRFPLPAPTRNGREDGMSNSFRNEKPSFHSIEQLSDLQHWNTFKEGIIRQRQDKYVALLVKPELGNLEPSELMTLAEVSEKYGSGYTVLTQTQNVLIPWIKEEFIYDIYNFLLEKSFFKKTFGTTRDIVSCPGAFSCRLAITHPYHLARDIGRNNEDLGDLRIHISGCPNSCGQHHIGDVGLYGASIKIGNKLVPHYVVLLGGNIQHGHIGKVIGKVPARSAHTFIHQVVALWNKKRQEGETFYQFVDRVGVEPFRKMLAGLSLSEEVSDDFYKEPGFDEDFKMEAESRGECAGSLLDLMAINLFDAIRNIYEAEDDIKAGRIENVRTKCLDAILSSARMFVYLEGLEPQSEEEILADFSEKIAAKNWLCNDWSTLKEQYYEWKTRTHFRPEELIEFARKFVYDCDKSFVRLQPNLKIAVCAKSQEEEVYG